MIPIKYTKNYNTVIYASLYAFFILLRSSFAFAACEASLPETTPTAQFTDNLDGTVSDSSTGLMWARCTLGSTYSSVTTTCDNTVIKPLWNAANASGPSSTLAGYDDWRLPNIKEIQTLVERQCFNPAMNDTVFSSEVDLSARYWSSTPSVIDGEKAWFIDFDTGFVAIETKTSENEIRLVRGGI